MRFRASTELIPPVSVRLPGLLYFILSEAIRYQFVGDISELLFSHISLVKMWINFNALAYKIN